MPQALQSNKYGKTDELFVSNREYQRKHCHHQRKAGLVTPKIRTDDKVVQGTIDTRKIRRNMAVRGKYIHMNRECALRVEWRNERRNAKTRRGRSPKVGESTNERRNGKLAGNVHGQRKDQRKRPKKRGRSLTPEDRKKKRSKHRRHRSTSPQYDPKSQNQEHRGHPPVREPAENVQLQRQLIQGAMKLEGQIGPAPDVQQSQMLGTVQNTAAYVHYSTICDTRSEGQVYNGWPEQREDSYQPAQTDGNIEPAWGNDVSNCQPTIRTATPDIYPPIHESKGPEGVTSEYWNDDHVETRGGDEKGGHNRQLSEEPYQPEEDEGYWSVQHSPSRVGPRHQANVIPSGATLHREREERRSGNIRSHQEDEDTHEKGEHLFSGTSFRHLSTEQPEMGQRIQADRGWPPYQSTPAMVCPRKGGTVVAKASCYYVYTFGGISGGKRNPKGKEKPQSGKTTPNVEKNPNRGKRSQWVIARRNIGGFFRGLVFVFRGLVCFFPRLGFSFRDWGFFSQEKTHQSRREKTTSFAERNTPMPERKTPMAKIQNPLRRDSGPKCKKVSGRGLDLSKPRCDNLISLGVYNGSR